MTALSDIIGTARPADGGLAFDIPVGWLQGRTAYGGLSSALALHAAQQSTPDLPPLRSMTIAFVGPLAGTVMATARLLRRGKNAVFVAIEVTGDAGIGLSASFVFVQAMASRIEHRSGTAPDFPVPGPDTRVFRGPAGSFVNNFEMRDDRSGGRGMVEWLRWIRLDQREGLDPMVHLVAIADALPPAAFKLIGEPAPISSMTWLCNLLTPHPQTRDGWWLLRAVSNHAVQGCSSQTMDIWNADGEPIASGMQSVAIFA